jgi:hypothetical protein
LPFRQLWQLGLIFTDKATLKYEEKTSRKILKTKFDFSESIDRLNQAPRKPFLRPTKLLNFKRGLYT